MVSRKRSLAGDNPGSQSGGGYLPFRLITLGERAAAWREEWPRFREQYEVNRETAREIRSETEMTRQKAEMLREEAERLKKRGQPGDSLPVPGPPALAVPREGDLT